MSKYRVVREDYYNERGISFDTCFFIQKQKSFLFFKRWVYITHKDVGIKTLNKVPLHFKGGLLEAEDFIKDVLSKDIMINGHHLCVLREYDSKGITI